MTNLKNAPFYSTDDFTSFYCWTDTSRPPTGTLLKIRTRSRGIGGKSEHHILFFLFLSLSLGDIMQEQQAVPSVLEYLSFEAEQDKQEQATTMPTTPNQPRTSSNESSGIRRPTHMQGILWKRRDVFRNRWRPRWFVLHSDQRVMTYYLLNNQDTEQVVSGASVTTATATPKRRVSQRSYNGTPSSSSMAIGTTDNASLSANDDDNNNNNNPETNNNRRRTLSETSTVTANTVDCDIVPRGSIYLAGSTVEANEVLTRPEEDLYVLTITDHENASGSCYHLAARTTESRDEWIHRIRVCQQQPPRDRSADHPHEPRAHRALVTPPRGTGRTTTTTTVERTQQHPDDRSGSRRGSSVVASKAGGRGGGAPSERTMEEALVLFAPLVVYKLFVMVSLFRLASLCFAATSMLALRWVLVRHLFTLFRPCADDDVRRGAISGNPSLTPIGRGSICCRWTEDLGGVRGAESDAASLSSVLVRALGKTIDRQPLLVSKKLHLLPRLYSTDVAYLDLADGSGEVWISKADEKNLKEISDVFTAAKHRGQRSQPSFLQRFIGPACRIVSASRAGCDEDDDIHVDLTLTDSPITVYISLGTSTNERNKETARVSISFQSTDVNACREFANEYQRSIRSSVSQETK